MPDLHHFLVATGRLVVIVPALLVVAIGLPSLVGKPLAEQWITRLVRLAMIAVMACATIVRLGMIVTGEPNISIDQRALVAIGGHGGETDGFHFAFKFTFDRLSAPFALLTYLLCGVISIFGSRYLHREAGFNRFFVFFALFVLGMIVTTMAGNIETLFTGWELVGISSALLVAFFHERRGPVENGLRVWSVYRLSDAALL